MEPDSITGSEWPGRARALKDEGWQPIDLCGVDRLTIGGQARFEIVVHLRHPEHDLRRIHVFADGDPPAVPSVTELWPTCNAMEREAYDLFGIHFEGHPNLTRIFMPDEWEGWPLRKDYGVGKVPIEFIPQPVLQIDTPGQSTHADEAEHQVDALGQAGPPLRQWGGGPGMAGPREDASR